MRFVFRTIVFLALLTSVVLLTPPADAAPPRSDPQSYVVQVGDTLYAIAVRYHTTVAALKKQNGLTSDLIRVGQKLDLPSGDSTAAPTVSTYVVQPGDTLSRIAFRYGTTVRALEDLNGIPNPNLIMAGQALAVPASASLVKPGLTVDPQTARQGGTLMIQLARPDLAAATAKINGKSIPMTRAAGYFYALAGISRCAKLGPLPLSLVETDTAGQTATETATLSVAATAFPVQDITLPPGKETLLDPALVNKEAAELNAIVGRYTPSRLWSGTFRRPVSGGIISSQFGHRRSYNGGPVGACGHEGIDFAIAAGTPVYSDARGEVMFAGLTQVRGNMVVVDHGLGVFTAYFHLSEIDVQVGQMVEGGTLIGKVGTTGLSTGPHLHWSMWVNGEYVDPAEWTRRIVP